MKDIMKSKTMLGIAIMAIATIADRHGYELDTKLIMSDLSDIMVILGCALAVYGRIKAKGPMTFTKGETNEKPVLPPDNPPA